MEKTKKPYKQAVDLARVRIGKRYVLLRLEDGVVQFGADNDVIMNAMTVVSTDYSTGTITYHAFGLKDVATAKLEDLGIPILEKGEVYSDKVVTVKFGHAVKAVHKHINDLRAATRSANRDEVTLGDRQLMNLHA